MNIPNSINRPPEEEVEKLRQQIAAIRLDMHDEQNMDALEAKMAKIMSFAKIVDSRGKRPLLFHMLIGSTVFDTELPFDFDDKLVETLIRSYFE